MLLGKFKCIAILLSLNFCIINFYPRSENVNRLVDPAYIVKQNPFNDWLGGKNKDSKTEDNQNIKENNSLAIEKLDKKSTIFCDNFSSTKESKLKTIKNKLKKLKNWMIQNKVVAISGIAASMITVSNITLIFYLLKKNKQDIKNSVILPTNIEPVPTHQAVTLPTNMDDNTIFNTITVIDASGSASNNVNSTNVADQLNANGNGNDIVDGAEQVNFENQEPKNTEQPTTVKPGRFRRVWNFLFRKKTTT
ncbi:MAG: hypothetical protein WC436_01815 [Candidatus Babeliales bacterium]